MREQCWVRCRSQNKLAQFSKQNIDIYRGHFVRKRILATSYFLIFYLSTLNLEKSTLFLEKSILNLKKWTLYLEKSTLILEKSILNSENIDFNLGKIDFKLGKIDFNLGKIDVNLGKSTLMHFLCNMRQCLPGQITGVHVIDKLIHIRHHHKIEPPPPPPGTYPL